MTLEEIKKAVEEGKTVHWKQDNHVVRKDSLNQWHIICTNNNYTVGLTWQDGVTMNGDPQDFFIA